MIILRTWTLELRIPESLWQNLKDRGFLLSVADTGSGLLVECGTAREHIYGSTGGIRFDIIEALNGRVKPEDIPRILARSIDSSDASQVTHYRQVLGTFRRAIYEAILEVGYEATDTEEVRGAL